MILVAREVIDGEKPMNRGFQTTISELPPSHRHTDNLRAFDTGAEAIERL
jgi:hypothetical protein